MKRSIIVAALLMSMAVPVFAEEELIWEEQAATEDVGYAESVFEEEETTSEEQTASEDPEYVFEEPETIEEQITEEEIAGAEIAFYEGSEEVQEDNVEASVFEEQVVTEDVTTGDISPTTAVAVEGLVYTGEPQELITLQPGAWLYSLDGETYEEKIPMAINAGTYTVYLKEGDTDPVSITVTIAKADVIFTPPVASSTITRSEAATARADGEEPAYADEPAYAVGEESDEVVFEVE